MKTTAILLSVALLSLGLRAEAQTAASAPPKAPPIGVTAPPPRLDLGSTLSQLQQTAGTMSLNLSRLRIEKWKADGSVKKQSQADADSITRNLTAGLPAVMEQVRANPQSLAAAVKLYRNVNALYDVFAALTELAGAYAPKTEYTPLAGDAGNLDNIRRDLGDKLEQLAATADMEIVRLRTEGLSKPAPAPTKIIVDEKPPAKPARKKPAKTTKPAGSKPAPNKPVDSTGSAPVTK
jgi:hypothetical protein